MKDKQSNNNNIPMVEISSNTHGGNTSNSTNAPPPTTTATTQPSTPSTPMSILPPKPSQLRSSPLRTVNSVTSMVSISSSVDSTSSSSGFPGTTKDNVIIDVTELDPEKVAETTSKENNNTPGTPLTSRITSTGPLETEIDSKGSLESVATTENGKLIISGLSNEEGTRRFLEVAEAILDKHYNAIQPWRCFWEYLKLPYTLAPLISAFILIGFFIYLIVSAGSFQFRSTGVIVEAVLLILSVVWNGYVFIHERRLTAREMSDRASELVTLIKTLGISTKPEPRIPTSLPTVSSLRVIRERNVRFFPSNLLVQDDIVQLTYGEIAPAKMAFVSLSPSSSSSSSQQQSKYRVRMDYVLEAKQVLKPQFFGTPPTKEMMEELQASSHNGRYYFKLLETPLESSLEYAISNVRPKTVVENQLAVLSKFFLRTILWMALFISLVINVIRYAVEAAKPDSTRRDQAFEILIISTVYALLPLFPLSIPSLMLLSRSFGNAKVLNLFEALQSSKTEYEDKEDIDEFDAAPPPTKDIKLDKFKLLKRFRQLFWGNDSMALTRCCSLVENLGHTTVVTVIDREGTISNPFPCLEQLFFMNESGEPIILDVTEEPESTYGVKFEDRDWQKYISSLKPLGLNFLLNTDCGTLKGRKRIDHHRKTTYLNMFSKTKPARQTCLCRFGREMGFVDEVLQSFVPRRNILTFSPYHDNILQSPNSSLPDYHFEIPNMASQIFEETKSGRYQLLSEGNLALILEFCADYWNGKMLASMNESVEKRIMDFYQTAIVNDLQVVGYSYRPIQNADKIPVLTRSNTLSLESTHTMSSFRYASMTQLFAQDPSYSPNLIFYYELPYSGDSATAPSEPESQLSTPLEASASVMASPIQNISSSNLYRDQTLLRQIKKKKLYSEIDSPQVGELFKEEKKFYGEVIKGQTFLSLATFAHNPTSNVVDFIEDIGLGGIRFVYFSPSPERESKAFAERLGLEISWNSCVLLSAATGEGNGYRELHDIKARLPRGIENIRSHIENVDDIPLHVSLFAECSPYATREMIKIFQEYGEVVCCVGSALNLVNSRCFAMADFSVAIEPLMSIKTRIHTKSKNGAQLPPSPFAIAAAINSLPAALTMPPESSFFSLTQIIRESRTFMTNSRQGLSFLVGCHCALTVMYLISDCFLVPPIFQGYHIFWMMYLVLPILTMSFIFSPHDPDVMTLMPVKNLEHCKNRLRFMSYFAIRFAPVVIMCVVVFMLTLSELYGQTREASIFGEFGNPSWMTLTESEQWAWLYAQNLTMVVFIYYAVVVSSTFLHRTRSVFSFSPFKNIPWVCASLFCIVLQVVFCAVSLHNGPFSLSNLPWYIYVLAFCWPIIMIPVQELVKIHDKEEWTRFQKRSKLEFNTKLGMHSPI